MAGETSPMVRVRRVTSARAAGEGLYCSWAIACSTRSRVEARTFGMSLITRETVWWDTPARRATSKMLAARPRPDRPPAGVGSLIELVRSGHERGQAVGVQGLGQDRVDDPAVEQDGHPVT